MVVVVVVVVTSLSRRISDSGPITRRSFPREAFPHDDEQVKPRI